jgi:hypothetical protein
MQTTMIMYICDYIGNSTIHIKNIITNIHNIADNHIKYGIYKYIYVAMTVQNNI